MRPMRLRPFDKEFGVERNAPAGIDIKLHHPAVDSLRIELRIDSAVKGIGEVDAFAVAADLHHLRSAIERLVRRGMRCPRREPIRTLPVSFGLNGSDTSYRRRSPVPQQDT